MPHSGVRASYLYRPTVATFPIVGLSLCRNLLLFFLLHSLRKTANIAARRPVTSKLLAPTVYACSIGPGCHFLLATFLHLRCEASANVVKTLVLLRERTVNMALQFSANISF